VRFLITHTRAAACIPDLTGSQRMLTTIMQSEPHLLPATDRIEEETAANYQADKYYPVELGNVLHARYQVIARIGFGYGLAL